MPDTHPSVIAIDVVGDSEIPQQTRTYAEYRMFAILTKHHARPRQARLALRSVEPQGACRFCECDIALHFRDGVIVSVAVRGPHPYAAINRAIDRIDAALAERRDTHARALAES
jgi:ribosome-associated translation inhibitor RaiA